MSAGYAVGVIGATGAVGREFLQVMEERRFPVRELRLWASPRSRGRQIEFNGKPYTVEALDDAVFEGLDFVLISASGDISRAQAPRVAQAGALAIDDSSAFRYDDAVPLVVPEVNAEDIAWHKGIVAIPNCSTTPIVQVLAPLHAVNPLRRIIADTYQSVSGAGGRAMEELSEQTAAQARGETPAVDPDVFPHQIASNLIPSIDSPRDDGYSKEEWKVWAESRKIMHVPDLAVSATCVRVPVFRAHAAAVHAEFSEPFDAAEARAMLEDVPGVQVVDDLAADQYPMPSDAAGNDTTWVGRIRQDMSHPNGLVFWVVSDNLRKGAATNSIQIAEAAIANHWLKQAQPA